MQTPPWLTATARHLKYTIPPAVLLTWLYRPFYTKLDAYKVVFLVLVCMPAAPQRVLRSLC